MNAIYYIKSIDKSVKFTLLYLDFMSFYSKPNTVNSKYGNGLAITY